MAPGDNEEWWRQHAGALTGAGESAAALFQLRSTVLVPRAMLVVRGSVAYLVHDGVAKGPWRAAFIHSS